MTDEEFEKLGVIEKLVYRIDCLESEVKTLKGQYIKNDFIIIGNKKAMKILNCCEQSLKKARDDGRLLINTDYKYNGSTYTYSQSSLHNKRGEI